LPNRSQPGPGFAILAVLAGALPLWACAGTVPVTGKGEEMAQHQTGAVAGPATVNVPRGTAKFGSDWITYEVEILAPDDCYSAAEQAEVSHDESTVRVRRILERQPGLCAQVMTPVRFTGRIADLPASPGGLAIDLTTPSGAVLQQIEIILPE